MTLLEIKIIEGNVTKKYTVSINDQRTKKGNNVTVFVPQSEDERKRNITKEVVGWGKVFWTDGKINTAKDCKESEYSE